MLGMFYTGAFVYHIPLISIGFIYFYIVRYIKKQNTLTVQQNRRQANQRDLVVLRRIIILLGVLLTVGLPTTGLYLWYLITGYSMPMIYHVQLCTISIEMASLPIIIVFIQY